MLPCVIGALVFTVKQNSPAPGLQVAFYHKAPPVPNSIAWNSPRNPAVLLHLFLRTREDFFLLINLRWL